jgi:glutamate-ammonia-ligase adenylyltransferase
MRLRPSGSQGPVAVTLDRFENYHREHSWTWELMALTRARVVAGPCDLRHRIESIVPGLLSRRGNSVQLKTDAREMRQRLAAQFPARVLWDLKFAAGGLVDIEFAAQLLQLCAAGTGDVLDQNTIRSIEKLIAAGSLDPADGESLIAAARLQQDLTQVLRVAIDGEFRPETASAGLKALLARVAGLKDFARLEPLLQRRQKLAHAIFERILNGR